MKISLKEHEINNILRYMRENAELTQKECGKLINKSERTIQQYESGKRICSLNTFKILCDKLEMKVIIEDKNKRTKNN